MSFEDRSGPPPAAEPSRPSPRRDPTVALTTRVRSWIQWIGAGRIVTTVVTVLAVVAGGWWLLRTPPPPTEAGLPYAATSTTSTTSTGAATAGVTVTTAADAEVVVHVAGAVGEPGVYELPSGSRVHVAIAAAGGTLPKAEPSALNLAAPLVDGERVYVPRVGESVPVAVEGGSSDVEDQPTGPIDVNHATVDQLDELPGVGPATAAAIVDHREQNGPFAAVDDLEAVRGIGPAKLEAIRDLVSV